MSQEVSSGQHSPAPSHGGPHSGRTASGAVQLGREPSPKLDEGRAAPQDCREDGRGHGPQHQDQAEGRVSISAVDQGAEPGLKQEEGRCHRVLPDQVGRVRDPQQDDPAAPDGRHEEDHGHHRAAPQREGGLRQAWGLHVCRDSHGVCGLCQLDQANLSRGQEHLRPTLEAPCLVAGGPGQGRATSPDRPVGQVQGLHQAHIGSSHIIGTSNDPHQVLLSEMLGAIKDLRQEVASLKQEPARKKVAKQEESEIETDGSFTKVRAEK